MSRSLTGPGPGRLRRAFALTATFEDGRLVLRNALHRGFAALGGPEVVPLAGLDDYAPRGALLRRLRAAGVARPGVAVDRLLDRGVLVEEGTPEAARDEALRATWRWGPLAAAFHRSLRDPPFVSTEEGTRLLAERARQEPPPPALPGLGPGGGAGAGPRALPLPRVRSRALAVLGRRRSTREFSPEPLLRQEVADVLWAGLGVRGVARDPVQGDLPLKLAPSGGARNPLDGHLYALRVRGLAPGAYRYDGLTRDLVPGPRGARIAPRFLLGEQAWTDGAAAIVFLVATFGRTAWKYPHPIAYRVVHLEAGHVAQNLLVAACDLGLAATPTCAFADGLVERVLGVGGPDQALVHAVVLGRPAR